jgi:hypothetical protein
VKEIQGADQRAILLTHITYRSHVIPGPQALEVPAGAALPTITLVRSAAHSSPDGPSSTNSRLPVDPRVVVVVVGCGVGGGGGLCVWTAHFRWSSRSISRESESGIKPLNQRPKGRCTQDTAHLAHNKQKWGGGVALLKAPALLLVLIEPVLPPCCCCCRFGAHPAESTTGLSWSLAL